MGIQINGTNDTITTNDGTISIDGSTTLTGSLTGTTGTFSGDVGVAGTLTSEDKTNIDSVGLITARTGIKVGPITGVAATHYADGSIRTTGIVTATTFVGNLTGNPTGSGANLTSIPAGQLTGALPAISGASLTGINTAFGNSSVNTTGIITATAFIPSTGQLSHRNLIINGAMSVAQRGTAEVTAANDTNTYRADRFKFAENTSGSVGMSIQDGTGEFSKCVKVRVLSTDTSVGSNDRASIQTIIEDLDVKHLQWGTANAKTVTLSFWVKSNVAGQTFCLNVYNSGTNNRTYIAEYTLPGGTANTWQKKTLTIPGDTTGTWGHIGVRWVLMGGSDKVGSLGWQAWSGSGGLEMQTSNQYNWMGDSNDFHLTGVQLEVGSVATPFEHRSYGEELSRCQRYYQVGSSIGAGYGSANGYARAGSTFATQMRTTPTFTATNTGSGSIIATGRSNTGFYVTYGSLGGTSAGIFNFTAESEL
tara:strand:- start:449 stop:1879 length:1431 start_codon:yes stop_codon:yes gene_type:complete